jgi:hypothetical protein
MSALPNFQELARQEAMEFQLEQKIERFERERSDVIMRNVRASMDFIRFVGDISNLFFPVFLDTVLGVSGDLPEENAFSWEDEEENFDEQKNKSNIPNTPDQGAVDNPSDTPPGGDGPTDI